MGMYGRKPDDYPFIRRSSFTAGKLLDVDLDFPGSFVTIFQAAMKLPKTVPAVQPVQLCSQTAKPVSVRVVRPVHQLKVSVDAQSAAFKNMKINPDTRSVGRVEKASDGIPEMAECDEFGVPTIACYGENADNAREMYKTYMTINYSKRDACRG